MSRFSYKRAEVFAGYTIPAALKKAPRTPCLTVTKSDLSDILGTGKLYQDHIQSVRKTASDEGVGMANLGDRVVFFDRAWIEHVGRSKPLSLKEASG